MFIIYHSTDRWTCYNNNNNNNNNRPRTTNPICSSGITKSTENEQVRLIRFLKLLYIIILLIYTCIYRCVSNSRYLEESEGKRFLEVIRELDHIEYWVCTSWTAAIGCHDAYLARFLGMPVRLTSVGVFFFRGRQTSIYSYTRSLPPRRRG